ncbi:MAG: hypothetical protein IKA10_03820 [Oscillospiraceae bacterium]|nr:hypothetical protein [Oscillospiraceae bacterium]
MQTFKTFLITFLSSVCIVLVSFAALYHIAAPLPHTAGTQQGGVPITRATAADNKTTLVFLQNETDSIFLLVKLNAVDSAVTVTAVPPHFYLPLCSRTLLQSFEYAGIMQCVQDLSVQLDATIDFHLVLDSDSLPLIDISFLSKETTGSVSPADCKAFAGYTAQTIKNHMTEIQTATLPSLHKNLSFLYTNIGKAEAAQLDRILALLQRSEAEYSFDAISDSQQ